MRNAVLLIGLIVWLIVGLRRYDEQRVGGDDGARTSLSVSELPEAGAPDSEGKMTRSPGKGGGSVPRTIYTSWISRDMPPGMKSNLDKWRNMNEDDHSFVFFDDGEQRAWMERNCTDYSPAWRDMELPVARADLFRYCLLFMNGGIWADVDLVPIRPLRDFVPPNADLVVVHDGGMAGEDDHFLYNAFLAAAPGHPVLKRAMDIVAEHHRIRLREGAVFVTGPRVLWRAANDALEGGARPQSFVGSDEERGVEYLYFGGNEIMSAEKGMVLRGKYEGYLDDATMHGGEPHYGREVTWSSTKV